MREMGNFTRNVSNWGGTHPGVTIQPDGSVTNTGEWYSTNIPCGRIQLGNLEDPIELDFWTNRSESAVPQIVDLTGTSTEDPF